MVPMPSPLWTPGLASPSDVGGGGFPDILGFIRRYLLDYLCCQDVDPDVGALRGPAQQVECFVGPTPVLCHQDALGLLNYRHGLQPGLQPGERGAVQYLPLGPPLLDLVKSGLQPFLGSFKPPRL